MKALTIRQPWSSLIAAGVKPVENRSWMTRYRGPLLIHAGRGVDRAPGALALDALDALGLALEELPAGGIVARAQLVDVVRDSGSPWAEPGAFHWVLADVQPVEFEPCRGNLGLWDWGDDREVVAL